MTAVSDVERLDLGLVARETWRIVRARFAPLFLLAFVLAGLPTAIVQALQTRAALGDDGSFWPTLWILAAGMVTSAAAGGAITHMVARFLSGERATFVQVAALGLRDFPTLLATSVVVSFATTLGAVALIVPGVMIACAWFVWAPIVVVERLPVFRALDRSQALTRNNRLLLAGLFVLFFLAMAAVSALADAVTGGPGPFSTQPTAAQTGPFYIAVAAVTGALTSLAASVGTVVVYAELRRIHDGASPFGGLAEVFS